MKRVKLSKPGGLQNLMLEESTIPEPNDNQVLIRVMSSSLNYHDLLVALEGFQLLMAESYSLTVLEKS
ncbi:MAG: hypothetical protein CM15mP51_20230 [Porticoccaceae bacterium]|nr:MAG: hypothetical protein CM15mP51_20230 [Porticoccaceae bacterium]